MCPHNGGCGTCTGLVTVHNGDGRRGQVDYTVEYYTMGHLTKFVKPGAVRIDSTANTTVKNVAWKNPDGSKALIAYNTSGSTQTVKGELGRPVVRLQPADQDVGDLHLGRHAEQRRRHRAATGTITGLAGKCIDVAGANSANGTAVQLYDCNGTAAQQWTVGGDGTIRALGKCLDVTGGSHRERRHGAAVRLQRQRRRSKWTVTRAATLVNPQPSKCLDVTDNISANGTQLQIWTCTGAANQRWTVPA